MMLRNLLILLLFAAPLSAAENVKAFGAVAKANIKAVGAVAEANIKALGVVDNTGSSGGSWGPLDFSGAGESLGTGWTDDIEGDWDRVSDTARPITTGFAMNLAAYTGTAVGVEQWCLVNFNDIGGAFPGVLLRYVNSSSPFYAVTRSAAGSWEWSDYANTGASGNTVDSDTIAADDPDNYGFTVSGTGASTTIRIWKNPSGASPTSATVWGGAGPNITLTGTPASAANTGTFIGLIAFQSSTPIVMDNMSAGTLP